MLLALSGRLAWAEHGERKEVAMAKHLKEWVQCAENLTPVPQ